MKTLRILVTVLILGSGLLARDSFEQNTLFRKGTTIGGYIGPVSFIGKINNEYAVFTGGNLAMLVDHRLIIGMAGYGLVNGIDISPDLTTEDSTRYLEMGYGGLELGYIIAPSQVIHIRVSSLFGIGGMGSHTHYRWDGWDDDWDSDYDNDYDFYNDVFFVVQPALVLELNMAKFFRIDVGATYRYASDFEFEKLKAGDLDGLAVTASINFGFY